MNATNSEKVNYGWLLFIFKVVFLVCISSATVISLVSKQLNLNEEVNKMLVNNYIALLFISVFVLLVIIHVTISGLFFVIYSDLMKAMSLRYKTIDKINNSIISYMRDKEIQNGDWKKFIAKTGVIYYIISFALINYTLNMIYS